MSKALLMCNGTAPSTTCLRRLARQVDFVLAADGGADKLEQAGLLPDAVLGDLDSVSPRARHTLKNTPFIAVSRQDNTDLEKALDWLIKQKFDEVYIAAADGGRIDFTVGNLLAVRRYISRISLRFCGENWQIFPVNRKHLLQAPAGTRVSLLPLTACRGVSLTGCQYPLKNARLDGKHIGSTLSNRLQCTVGTLSMQSGYLLLYVENPA